MDILHFFTVSYLVVFAPVLLYMHLLALRINPLNKLSHICRDCLFIVALLINQIANFNRFNN